MFVEVLLLVLFVFCVVVVRETFSVFCVTIFFFFFFRNRVSRTEFRSFWGKGPFFSMPLTPRNVADFPNQLAHTWPRSERPLNKVLWARVIIKLLGHIFEENMILFSFLFPLSTAFTNILNRTLLQQISRETFLNKPLRVSVRKAL